MENSSSKPVFIAFVFLAILPIFYLEKYIYGYNVPKILMFWILVYATLGFAIFKIFYKNNLQIKVSIINILVLVFLIVMSISGLVGSGVTASFFSSFERMDGILNFLFFTIFLITFSQQKISNSDWQSVLRISCTISFLISVLAIKQHLENPLLRSQGSFSNPLSLGIYLVFHIFLISNFWFSALINKTNPKKIQLFVSLIFCGVYLYALTSSATRSSFLALFVGTFFSLIYLLFTNQTSKKTVISFSVCFFALCYICFRAFNVSPWAKRILNYSNSDNSISVRLELWKISLKGFWEKPLLGWGKENFVHFFVKNYNNKLVDSGDWYDRSHNFLIDKLIETGLLGFLSFTVLFIFVLIILFKKTTQISNTSKATIFGFLIAYFVCLFTSFESHISYLIFFSLLIYLSQFTESKYFDIPKLNFGIKILLIAAYGLFGYLFVYKTTKTYLSWNTTSKKYLNTNTVAENESNFEASIVGRYDLTLSMASNRLKLNSPGIDNSLKFSYLLYSKKQLLDLLKIYPDHPIIMSQLGFLEFETGETDHAILTFEKLKMIAPNRHINLIDLGMMYLKKKNFEKALKIFDEIIAMDPNYKLAVISKAYCFINMGATHQATMQLNNLSLVDIVKNMDKSTELFRMTNRYKDLIDKLESATVLEFKYFKPNTYLRWIQLAVLTNRPNSVKTAIQACVSNNFFPQKETEINELINGIINKDIPPEAFYEMYKEVWWY
ncbi:hypothetical protein EGI26_10570 [Lacihabitans sp. CCS-44]|uniref:O-antigen ligase family protein n=1 Tax=Lacihabitans sp. CCS-44 TaxID=2487331 RepID=UPI0020CE1966|nr:O-antigen ligase family protein [Lacihabitans sp. CCS-44]MCP9755599.1 hypothetical protein [Lacihabitans sp. CCS-44]